MSHKRAISKGLLAVAALALFPTGLTWALPDVESRSRSPSWSAEEAQSQEGSSRDLIKQMEFLQQEVMELRGKVEEQTHELQQLQASQKKLYLDLDQRIQSPSAAPKISEASGIHTDVEDEVRSSNTPGVLEIGPAGEVTQSSTQTKHQVAVSAAVSADTALMAAMPKAEEMIAEEKAYQQAYRLVQKKDFDGAIAAFKSLAKSFPHGKYIANANYWLGEIYLVKGDYDLAHVAFETVYHNYPQHPKAADSLLKLGYVAYAKGEWKHSQELLNQVKSQFPGTTSSQLADSRLDRMHQEGRL